MIARKDEALYVVVVFSDGMMLAEPAATLLNWPSDILCGSAVSFHPKDRAMRIVALSAVTPTKTDSRSEGVGGTGA